MSNQKENMERLKAGVRASSGELRQVVGVLPNGDTVDIYFKPMTLREKGKILKTLERNPAEAVVETLIVRARDKDGGKLYSLAQKSEFMSEPGLDNFVEEAVKTMDEADADDAIPGSPDPEN